MNEQQLPVKEYVGMIKVLLLSFHHGGDFNTLSLLCLAGCNNNEEKCVHFETVRSIP